MRYMGRNVRVRTRGCVRKGGPEDSETVPGGLDRGLLCRWLNVRG
jgi:hypothetical protein